MKTKDQLRNYQVVVQLQTEYQEQSDVFDEWLTGATDRFTLCTLPENVQLENTEVRGLVVEFFLDVTPLLISFKYDRLPPFQSCNPTIGI